MTRVQYFTACTVDGFIADEHDSLDWLFEAPHSPDDGYWDRWFPGVGALVMGATTYRWMCERHGLHDDGKFWHDFYGDRPGWVFSHNDLPGVPGVEIAIVQGDVRPVYDAIAARIPDQDIWIVGGGDLVGQFHDAGLLDQIILGMAPVTLGRGAPLLPRRITSDRLRFRQAELLGQRIRIVLDVQTAVLTDSR